MLYKCVGYLFLGLAVLGVALPVLPTTPFVLVAASCFAKSSPALHRKLLNNKVFGPLIINWQTHRVISLKAKVIALATMFISMCWSIYMLDNIYLQVLVAGLISGPFVFILTVPSKITPVEVRNDQQE